MRVFTVLGPSQSGKSALTHALSNLDGGRPERFSGDVDIHAFSYLGDAWTAIDVPGGSDALAQAGPALAISDAAVLCVPPEADAAVLCAPYLRMIEEAEIPCFLFINRMDLATERVRDIVAALQSYSAHHFVLRQVPMRVGGAIVGAVDLISERAWKYREGAPSALIEMPVDMIPREEEARAELLEALADFDDAILEQLIEDQQPLADDIYTTATDVLQGHKLIPAFLGSATAANGIVRLMKSLRHEAPNCDVARDRLGGAPIAASFLAENAKHLGKVVALRAFDNGVAPNTRLGGQSIGNLTRLDAKTPHKMLAPGAVGLAVKSDHLNVARAWTADADAPLPGWAQARAPIMHRAVHLVHEKDDARFSVALARLLEIDPGLSATRDEQSGHAVLGFQGTQHARRTLQKLKDSFGIDVSLGAVTPPYRETVRGSAEWHHRHRKQSGGAGQFADIVIFVAAQPRGSGFAFDETVKGGAVPRKFIPAVEAGVREALASGPSGFPMVDLSVTLRDGKHHAVDSSEYAFRTAGRAAMREVFDKMSTQILQPISHVEIHVPSIFAGGLVPVVSGLKGQVLGFEGHPTAAGWDVFKALLPASAEIDLSQSLGSLTRGTAWFDTAFDHYETCRSEDVLTPQTEEHSPA